MGENGERSERNWARRMKIEEVKKNLNKMVSYKEKTDVYMLTACILRKKDNAYFYEAELFDTKCGRSIVICKLDDVGVIE